MKTEHIYGIHVIRHFLQSKPEQVLEIYLLDTREDKRILEIVSLAKQFGISVQKLDKKQFEKQENTQGAIAKVRLNPPLTELDLPELIQQFNEKENENQKDKNKPLSTAPLFLVLDGIQDPHNFGACLRSADACNVTAVITPKDRAAPVSSVVRKVASGAAETVPIVQVTNLSRTLEQLKSLGVWILGTADTAPQTLYETDLTVPIAICLGAEGAGLRRLTKEHCDILMRIPMLGVVESLNVSVASAVCLFEAIRQRSC